MFDYDSKISGHVHENNHQIGISVRVVGYKANFCKQLFLEACMLIEHPQSGNDHIAIPEVLKSLACTQVLQYIFLKLRQNFCVVNTSFIKFTFVVDLLQLMSCQYSACVAKLMY